MKLVNSLFNRKWQRKIILCCLLASLYLFGSSGYIYAKAILAQYLIEDAWTKTLTTGERHPPWSWADTYPVAKLTIKDKSYFVLAGITGRTLAFGPGHMSSTPLPGKSGNSVIAGHRDTHFAILNDLSATEIIKVQTKTGKFHYQVKEINIEHQQNTSVTEPELEDILTLITCYPFDAITPNPEWRYVIKAVLL